MFKFKNRKGFFFVVTSLIILTYIITNLALWSETIESQEARYSENFKISNIDYAVSQVTEDAMKEFSEISVQYALYRLNQHSIDNPVKKGSDDEYGNIKLAIHDLIIEGSADSGYFSGEELVYSEENKSSYTFTGVFDTINKSFSKIGLEISKPEIKYFSFNQTAIDKITVSFNLSFTLKDLENSQASLKKEIPILFNVSIEGLQDPAIARELKKTEFGAQEDVEKQIFFYPENFNPSTNLKVESKISGKGQGWFYGPVYVTGAEREPDDELKPNYIIAGTENEIINSENYQLYGAYLLISEDEFQTISLRYDGKPMFVSAGMPSFSSCQGTGCFFFVSKYDPGASELDLEGTNPEALQYDIESFRDFVICGYYLPNELGPSYFQKLFEDSYAESSEKFGMATFLVWKGIEGDYGSDDNSRLDIEFFGDVFGIRVRGTSGCKYKAMCSESDSFVGQFKLSRDAMEKYLGDYNSMHFECDGEGTDDWSTCGDLE